MRRDTAENLDQENVRMHSQDDDAFEMGMLKRIHRLIGKPLAFVTSLRKRSIQYVTVVVSEFNGSNKN